MEVRLHKIKACLKYFVTFQIICLVLIEVNGHGRLLEPPSRSSLWRLPKYQDLDPPVNFNYDDDQLYCGGLGNMVNNGGKCGPCGDPYEMKRPREQENTGLFGEGIIVRNYEIGQVSICNCSKNIIRGLSIHKNFSTQ